MLTDQWLRDEAGDRIRAYKAADVAEQLDVTPKTVINWASRQTGAYPSLRGWQPRTDHNPNRHWLVDAGEADRLIEESHGRVRAGEADSDLVEERQRLADERELLAMERSVIRQERASFLEEENARLQAEVEELRAKVAAMGRVVFDLTTNPT